MRQVGARLEDSTAVREPHARYTVAGERRDVHPWLGIRAFLHEGTHLKFITINAVVCWLSLTAAGGLLGSPDTNATATPWTGTQRVQVTDPKYGITAMSFEIPAGWKFAGSIVRPVGCHSRGANASYTAQSPDGITALVALPGVTWSWTTSPEMLKAMDTTHCPGIDINTPAAFLVNIAVPNLHPTANAKIVAVLPLLPEGQASLAAQLKAQIANNASMPNLKMTNQTLEGARVRIQYVRDGHPIEEMIAAVVSCNDTPLVAMPGANRPAALRRTCSSRGTSIIRARQGELDKVMDEPSVKNLVKSVQPNPDWQNRVSQDMQAEFQAMMAANDRQFQANQKYFADQNAAMLARGRQFQSNMRAGTDAALATDRARQNAIDQSAHATALYSLDRQDFKNPATGQTIEASNEYNHQWLSSDGSTLIQTQDHTFDPNGQVYPGSQSWTELVPK